MSKNTECDKHIMRWRSHQSQWPCWTFHHADVCTSLPQSYQARVCPRAVARPWDVRLCRVRILWTLREMFQDQSHRFLRRTLPHGDPSVIAKMLDGELLSGNKIRTIDEVRRCIADNQTLTISKRKWRDIFICVMVRRIEQRTMSLQDAAVLHLLLSSISFTTFSFDCFV